MFTTDLHTVAGEPGEFVLTRPLVYEDTLTITVPVGFISDFASIPRSVQMLPGLHPNGKSRRAAVLHDYLYSCHGKTGGLTLTRADCDQLFREALRSDGVNYFTAYAMWAGVRAGGWLYWNKRKDGLDESDFEVTE